VALQYLKLRKAIKEEHESIRRIAKNTKIDGIISDNRYGVYSSQIPSVIITHQLRVAPKTPFKTPANNQLRKSLLPFSEIWIPDAENGFLTGKMSSTTHFSNVKYIGYLSRFSPSEKLLRAEKILALISGPEPYRTLLEDRLIKTLAHSEKRVVLVRGLPDQKIKKTFPENFEVHHHLSTKKLEELFKTANVLVSRAGYSTIMDCVRTGIPAVLIPTKGQSEQEYLAHRLKETFNSPLITAEKFTAASIKMAQAISIQEKSNLNTVIGNWLNQL